MALTSAGQFIPLLSTNSYFILSVVSFSIQFLTLFTWNYICDFHPAFYLKLNHFIIAQCKLWQPKNLYDIVILTFEN